MAPRKIVHIDMDAFYRLSSSGTAMNQPKTLEAAEYILDAFEATQRIAILALNRDLRETVQCITRAEKAASPSSKHGYATKTPAARTFI
ncbi:MAG TPA: hypothetical protein VIW23_02090 [Candidatus Acidoferrum sp.]|jgi:hypothetical protein